MKLIRIILTISICATALIGDYIVFKSKYSESLVFRAFADSTVHASIGFLSAVQFFSHEIGLTDQARLYNIAFCTIISSLIDVDHFIAARSFRLKDLTKVKERGIFHCTSYWILLKTVLLIYSHITRRLDIYILTFMLTLAYTSHHVRDANRRGLWLYPFGHTPPFSKYFYIFLLMILPSIFAYLYIVMKPAVHKQTVRYYDSIV
ncbi:unnamed protein product [Parnassius mnemosyne]|uniref:Transmembrane protein 267 n=1 Tax=Parnassius mnemosyne TaxID=213953 RepID=A0AAV1LAL3_9NEOP